MTSLLDGLELKPFYGYCRKDKILSGNANANSFVFDEDYETLKKALEAALVVIEASMILENAETVTEIQVADVRCRSAEKDLNIALAPFRKEGLG